MADRDPRRAPLLDMPGAVAGEADVSGIPLHFGDPSGEQWALEQGRGLVDRSDLAVIAVSGPDRQTWLTSMASQVVTGMGPGESRELLVLDPQGHIEHAAAVADDGGTTWLVTAGDRADLLVEWLAGMRFALRVAVARRDDLTVLATVTPGVAGASASAAGAVAPSAAPSPSAGAVAPSAAPSSSAGVQTSAVPSSSAAPSSHAAPSSSAAGDTRDTTFEGLPGWLLTWDDPWPGVVEGGTEYFTGRHPGALTRLHLHVVERDLALRAAREWMGAQHGRRPAGLLAWEAVRVAAWRPSIDHEVDERAIPAELDWLRTAVHTHKGCYRGQESVARVLNLGRPPRRLVFLQLDGSMVELPEAGTPIMRRGRRVGVLTSVARHADMGPIALALVLRSLPADEVLDIGGVAAAQEVIVPVDGRASDSPAQRPGAGLANPALRRTDVRGTSSGGLGPAL